MILQAKKTARKPGFACIELLSRVCLCWDKLNALLSSIHASDKLYDK